MTPKNVDAVGTPSLRARAARPVGIALYFVGATLGFVFLSSAFSAALVAFAATTCTAAYAARERARAPARSARVVGVVAWVIVALAYALWGYLAIAWGSVLLWSVRWWGWAVIALSLVGAGVTARRAWDGPRVPLALPLGAFVALLLWGWRTEEILVRCDDYLALAERAGTSLRSPTSVRLARCTPGEEVPIGRFPRVIWESPDAARLVITTQAAGAGRTMDGDRFHGAICEVRSESEPACIGGGRAQGLAESFDLARIFIASWGDRTEPGVRGVVHAIPLDGPLESVASVTSARSTCELFYDQDADRVYGFSDEGFEVLPFEGSTLAPRPIIDGTFWPPGAIRYDATRGEGVLCTAGTALLRIDGSPYVAIAVRGSPFSMRPLGGDGPLALGALTWGCDWDPETREVWVAVPNLGLLATIDYDTGAVLATHAVGFGLRSVTLDRSRRRLYVTDFLGGYVLAFDADTADEVDRWFVGRFPRTTTLSRSGASLYVGTNLGVVEIDLGTP